MRRYVGHYLAPHPSRGIRELYASKVILDFAVALVMLYEPIYLYRQGFSVISILGFYLGVYFLCFFLLPLGGKIGRMVGYERAMALSGPFLILYYLSFVAISGDWRFVVPAAVMLAIQKSIYWPSYHADFAASSQGPETGREISNLTALTSLVTAFAPALGGMLVMLGGWVTLFAVVIVLVIASNIPMLITPEISAGRGLPYLSAVRRVFRSENRRRFLAYLGYGEEMIALGLWPVFIALKVPDLLSLGMIVSSAMIVRVLVVLYTGGLVDEGARQPVLRNGVVFTAGSWLIRPLAVGGLGVFLFDAFYGVSKNMVAIPMASINYELSRSDRAEIDHAVFFEMALGVGKALACLLAMAIFWVFPDGWWLAFLLAGAFTALYALMRDG